MTVRNYQQKVLPNSGDIVTTTELQQGQSWYAFYCLNEVVFEVFEATGKSTGDLTGLPLQAGLLIPLEFTRFQLSQGAVIAYREEF